MNKGMRVADDLFIPWEVCSKRIFVCGCTGSGKTHTAAVMAEEMLQVGLQTVVIDPQDNWNGLRVARNGILRFPVPLLGGEFGDLPLKQEAGHDIGQHIAISGDSIILSTAAMSRDDQREFVRLFCEGLFQAKTEMRFRTPMHLIIDEVDRFAPQRLTKEKEPCFEAIDEIARRGRFRGIGMTLISQRPAVVNKDCVAMAQCLICMQLVLTHDRKAIAEWVSARGDKQGDEFLKSLSSLGRGEGWVWCPSSSIFKRVKVRDRLTQDTAATPEFNPDQPKEVPV